MTLTGQDRYGVMLKLLSCTNGIAMINAVFLVTRHQHPTSPARAAIGYCIAGQPSPSTRLRTAWAAMPARPVFYAQPATCVVNF